MKASYFEHHGGPEVLIYGDQPDPVPSPGEAIIDIHAASVNAADAKVRAGGAYGEIETFPYILGRDFSGVVASLGEGASDFTVGDEVFGVCEVGQEGTYAEKIAMNQALLSVKPDSLPHIDAACLALPGLTAIISLEETLKLQPGESILIQGGGGGVAGFAIELAKHIGAHVITTCSARNIDYVRGLGADEVINYTTQDFTEIVTNCDAVFETVGGEVTQKSFDVLKPGGRLAAIASGVQAPPSPRDDVESLRPAVGRDRKYMERIIELYEAGVVHVPPITVYSLADAAAASAKSESRHLTGKLAFQVR
ncbi:MAG: NADPH:quinone reductase [Alphaproteobacteria bacterium]|nr:NADPH:quinone reductase [Alphaproteobacteria bacterium]HCP00160.1 NADPH:quinone reductase [Rhodospirillaceae bacterium]